MNTWSINHLLSYIYIFFFQTFEQVGEEDELKTWCKNLGIDEDSLKDMATVNFIKEFIDQNGGIEAVKREGGSQSAPSRGTRTGEIRYLV